MAFSDQRTLATEVAPGQPGPPVGDPAAVLDPATLVDTPTLADLAPDPDWRRPVLAGAELLFLATEGRGTVELDFRPLTCRPGSLLRVRPGQALRWASPTLEARVLRWRPEAVAGVALPGGPGPRHWQLPEEDRRAVHEVLLRLAADRHRFRGPAAGDLVRHQLAALLLRLALLGPDPGPARGEHATYQRLRQEIEQSYRATRRVEDYAARLGCSVRTLTRACLAVAGRSAKQVIDERVALEATRLLAATDEPIAQIGRLLGFPEPTNFGRFFTREVGRSPGAFRVDREGWAGGGAATRGPGVPDPGAPGARIVRPRVPVDRADDPDRA